MNVRTILFLAVASIATSTGFAEQPQGAAAEPRPAAPQQTALEELAAGMREILHAVVPEIRLPAIELKLPTLDAAR